MKRGELYYADLGLTVGSEQGGIRPVVIIQNDIGNIYSPTTIVASITSKMKKCKLPTHVHIDKMELEKDSMIMLEQIRTIDKIKVKERIGKLDNYELKGLNKSLIISIGLA